MHVPRTLEGLIAWKKYRRRCNTLFAVRISYCTLILLNSHVVSVLALAYYLPQPPSPVAFPSPSLSSTPFSPLIRRRLCRHLRVCFKTQIIVSNSHPSFSASLSSSTHFSLSPLSFFVSSAPRPIPFPRTRSPPSPVSRGKLDQNKTSRQFLNVLHTVVSVGKERLPVVETTR